MQLDIMPGTASPGAQVNTQKPPRTIPAHDHRAIKRIIKPMMGFKDFRCARIILTGIELMHMIRKGQMNDERVYGTVAARLYSLVT